jgi:Mce-associated membrane protein
MSGTPNRPGWYPDPLKPTTQERRWDGQEWTEETREASVRDVEVAPAPAPRAEDLVEPEVPAEPEVPVEPEADPGAAPRSRRTTLALMAAAVVLLLVAVLEAAYLWGPLRDDPRISSGRPVLISQAAERSAVDTAARAAVAFTARTAEDYDAQVDEAAAMMTSSFAQEFRQTTDDAKADFVAAEAEVTAEVVAQGVITASEEQVEVLLFLNQFTTRKDEKSAHTPFRLKVTLIDADGGWLVSDVDAS